MLTGASAPLNGLGQRSQRSIDALKSANFADLTVVVGQLDGKASRTRRDVQCFGSREPLPVIQFSFASLQQIAAYSRLLNRPAAERQELRPLVFRFDFEVC